MSLDHLILLSAPNGLDKTKAYLSPWFSVVEGGTHKGGATFVLLSALPSLFPSFLSTFHFI